jgi:hypothetical protein
MTGLAPPRVPKNDWAQVVPSSSAEAMKQVSSWSG